MRLVQVYTPPTPPILSLISVYLNNAQVIPSGVQTVINFDTENFDTLGEFSTVTHRFVPQENGYYLVTLVAGISTPGDGVLCVCAIRQNLVNRVLYRIAPGGAQSVVLACSKILYVTTTDYIGGVFFQSSGGNKNAMTGDQATQMSIVKVG